jgi:hypothetical protein
MLMKPKKVVRKSRDWLDPKIIGACLLHLYGVGRVVYTLKLFDNDIIVLLHMFLKSTYRPYATICHPHLHSHPNPELL